MGNEDAGRKVKPAEDLEQGAQDHAAASAAKYSVSPEARANCISRLLFNWVSVYLVVARRKRKQNGEELEDEDLNGLIDEDGTARLSAEFEQRNAAFIAQRGHKRVDELSEKEVRQMVNSSLWGIVRRRMWFAGILRLVYVVSVLAFPILFNLILQVVQDVASGDPDVEPWHGYAFVAAFGVSTFLSAISDNLFLWLVHRAAWQIRSVLTTAVYRKTLRVSATARQAHTTGEIVNMMQIDAKSVGEAAIFLHMIWASLLQILGYMAILYLYVSWTAFIGIAIILLSIPFTKILFSQLMTAARGYAKEMDDRVKLVNEVLQGIQGIKMAGWELKFSERISNIRKSELAHIRTLLLLFAIIYGVSASAPTFSAIGSLSVFGALELDTTDAATLFTALTAFELLTDPLFTFPIGLTKITDAIVRRNRVASYLGLEESFAGDDEHEAPGQVGAADDKPVIEISNATYYWGNPAIAKQHKSASEDDAEKGGKKVKQTSSKPKSQKGQKNATQLAAAGESTPAEDGISDEPDESRPALSAINFVVKRGSIVGIAGPVGSGKTSLANAILGEMFMSEGSRALRGSVAFVAQTAWIFNGSVRDNILFGEPMDEPRYNAVVRACQLSHDLTVLQNGDQTMIGERGINLSGGQKQRISIARAAYSRRDIVILDDPLSALDPEVAGKVFKECIVKFLSDRTRVLVTNQLNLLPQCDQVVLVGAEEGEPGRIIEQGRYSTLVRSGLNFAKLVGHLADSTSRNSTEGQDHNRAATSEAVAPDVGAQGMNNDQGDALVTEEERAKGAVKLKTYFGYVKAGGSLCAGLLVLLSSIFEQGAGLLTRTWVTIWSDDANYQEHTLTYYLVGYGITGVLVMAFKVAFALGVIFWGLRVSRRLNVSLQASVFHAPMSFFDTTPTGRIVSRFSKDLNLIDRTLPQLVMNILGVFMMCAFAIGAIGFATPLFLVSLPFLLAVYLLLLNFYRPGMRDIKRLESISRSPIYNHFSETLNGLTTIRAYGSSSRFEIDNTEKVDANLRGWYYLRALEIWLTLRLTFVGNSIAIIAGSLALFAATQGLISPGVAGLSLTYAISTTQLLAAIMTLMAEIEATFNSVERVLFYSNDIPQEKAFRLGDKVDPTPEWPQHGAISIRDLRMRYRPDTPLVLKGVSLDIEPGMRVGVVGRTGGGKSSLLLSLMRLVEPEPLEDGSGPITIDGVDVSKIGLHALRSKISIVPQNPVIFSGTVRSNIDPFDQYGDDAIWDALERCSMRNKVEEAGGLGSEVAEFGENFSQGERQLLVLTRSLLANARILLLDEATSSVDHHTDAAIQATIRSSFQDCTILTIAHRLNTIIDSDRILVMDGGTVGEFDSPATLLADRGSMLSGMVAELGPAAAAQLRRAANPRASSGSRGSRHSSRDSLESRGSSSGLRSSQRSSNRSGAPRHSQGSASA